MRPIVVKRSSLQLGAFCALASLTLCAGQAGATPKEVGVWYDDTGKGAVKIEVCTPTTLCGKIFWLKDKLDDKGAELQDGYNPDPSMRKRPICGLPVLGGLEQQSDGGFDNGWVYDPKVGKQYSAAIELVSPNKLKLTGYAMTRMLGKSFIWTRAPKDLVSCDGDAASTDDGAAAAPAKAPTKKAPAQKLGASDVPAPVPAKHKKKTTGVATQQPPVASN